MVILLSGEILTGCGMSEVAKTTLAKTESTTSRFGKSAREETKSSSANPLAGTRWQMLEIQSMDETIGQLSRLGSIKPDIFKPDSTLTSTTGKRCSPICWGQFSAAPVVAIYCSSPLARAATPCSTTFRSVDYWSSFQMEETRVGMISFDWNTVVAWRRHMSSTRSMARSTSNRGVCRRTILPRARKFLPETSLFTT